MKKVFILLLSLSLGFSAVNAQEAQKSELHQRAESDLEKGNVASARFHFIRAFEDYAKKGDLSARREAARFIMDPKVLQDLFATIGPRYANRNGGYTRVLKLGPNRAGDASEMALVGLVEDEIVAKEKKAAAEPAKADAVSMVEGEGKSAE